MGSTGWCIFGQSFWPTLSLDCRLFAEVEFCRSATSAPELAGINRTGQAQAEQARQGKDFDSAADQPIDIACKGVTGSTEPGLESLQAGAGLHSHRD